ncbi:MAG: hypothetical protein SH859_14970 [Hyphomicrobium aestuarii]|nr:hypothetical protein [Hyphomicrobium aestuarii]
MTNGPNRRNEGEQLPKLVRFMLSHALVGALIGLAMAATLVSANVSGLRDLLMASNEPIVPTVLLATGFSTFIISVWVSAAVMLNWWDDDA